MLQEGRLPIALVPDSDALHFDGFAPHAGRGMDAGLRCGVLQPVERHRHGSNFGGAQSAEVLSCMTEGGVFWGSSFGVPNVFTIVERYPKHIQHLNATENAL